MLKNINYNKTYVSAQPGALVETFMGAFFLAMGADEIDIDGVSYCPISMSSPIGQVLKDKKGGEKVSFRGKVLEVYSICLESMDRQIGEPLKAGHYWQSTTIKHGQWDQKNDFRDNINELRISSFPKVEKECLLPLISQFKAPKDFNNKCGGFAPPRTIDRFSHFSDPETPALCVEFF